MSVSMCVSLLFKKNHVIPDSISYPDFSFDYKGKVLIYVVEDTRIKLLLLFVDHSDI